MGNGSISQREPMGVTKLDPLKRRLLIRRCGSRSRLIGIKREPLGK